MFRLFIQRALGYKIKKSSSKARDSWASAHREFKDFFKLYTREVFELKEKVYKIKIEKKKSKKRRNNPGNDQEDNLREIFEEKLDHDLDQWEFSLAQ